MKKRGSQKTKVQLGEEIVALRRRVQKLEQGQQKRKQVEEALRDSEVLLRAIVDNYPLLVTLKGLDDRYLLVNKYFAESRNTSIEDVIGKTVEDFESPDHVVKVSDHDREVIELGKAVTHEREWVAPNGVVMMRLVNKFPVYNADEKLIGLGTISTDITGRKRAEELIRESLKEKEVLLQEIHHRVKNNLQVISSMLSLQAGTETDSRSIEALNDSKRRVLVMAGIHETLHQSDDLASIHARDYLSTIVGDTRASSGENAKDVSCHLEVDDIVFDMDQAVPCGQVISELLFNSFKHAFSKGQSGAINVSLHRRDGGKIELTVADDGKGLPEGFDPRQSTTLGLRLVHALAMKLSGVVEFDGTDGTRVQITFPASS